jgi:hypothetical protein
MTLNIIPIDGRSQSNRELDLCQESVQISMQGLNTKEEMKHLSHPLVSGLGTLS